MKKFPGNFATSLTGIILCALVSALSTKAIGAPGRTDKEGARNRARAFVEKAMVVPPAERDQVVYDVAMVDLNRDGVNEALVYRRGWGCGSSGCNLFILKPAGSSYRFIGRLTIVRPPIRVLSSTSQGWSDIGVWVSGGGIVQGYEARMRFDGTKYPSNPTLAPASRDAKGITVVAPLMPSGSL